MKLLGRRSTNTLLIIINKFFFWQKKSKWGLQNGGSCRPFLGRGFPHLYPFLVNLTKNFKKSIKIDIIVYALNQNSKLDQKHNFYGHPNQKVSYKILKTNRFWFFFCFQAYTIQYLCFIYSKHVLIHRNPNYRTYDIIVMSWNKSGFESNWKKNDLKKIPLIFYLFLINKPFRIKVKKRIL